MIGEPIPQPAALRFQLGVIAGAAQSGGLEGRWRRTTGSLGRTLVPVRDLEHACRLIEALAPHTDTYIGAALYDRAEDGADVEQPVWALWATLDGPAAIDQLAELAPLPAIVVTSGPDRATALWPLASPLEPTDAVEANRELGARLGATDEPGAAATLLRPANTLDHDHTPPRAVVCSRLEPRKLAVAEILGR